MSRYLLIVLASLFTACAPYNNWRASRWADKVEWLNAGQETITVPFEFESGLIVIRTTVNGGSDTLRMIFDTGATYSLITSETARKLKGNKKLNIRVGDSHGSSRKLPMILMDSLHIGNALFGPVNAVIFDFPENSAIPCIAPDGIVGYNLMKTADWKIDFEEKLLTIYRETPQTNDRVDTWEMENQGGRPHFQLADGQQQLPPILLDLGSNGHLDLPVASRELEREKAITLIDGSSQGIFGAKPDTTYIFYTDSLGSEKSLFRCRIELSHYTSPKIGTAFLRNYNLLLSPGKEKLYLLPSGKKEDPTVKTFGIVPHLSENEFVISSLHKGTGAEDEGLAPGQKIRSINGIEARHFRMNYCEFFHWRNEFFKENEFLDLVLEDGREVRLKKVEMKGSSGD